MIYDRSDLKLKILDQGDISKCTWLLQQPALEIALQYNFYCMDEIPHISFEVCVFFQKIFLWNCRRKKSGKIFVTTHVMSSNMSKINWNWWHEIELFRVFQSLVPKYCLFCVQKKSWKFRMVSANASCSPGVLTSFLDQLQKDTIWL